MKFTVKPGSREILCPRCKWSTVVERRAGDTITWCAEAGGNFGVRVPPDIVKCNNFTEIGANSEHDYEKIAWVLRSDKSGKVLGFQPPSKKDEK